MCTTSPDNRFVVRGAVTHSEASLAIAGRSGIGRKRCFIEGVGGSEKDPECTTTVLWRLNRLDNSITYRPWLLSGVHLGTKKVIRINLPLERGGLNEHTDKEPKVDRTWKSGLRLENH